MSDLLIELFSEEIPARMQHAAAEGFLKRITEGLEKAGVAVENSAFYYTPRRLSVSLTGLPTTREAKSEEIKGPRVDGPEAAINGFLRKNSAESVAACVVKKIDGVDYYFIEKTQMGGDTIDALAPVIVQAIQNLAWPKSMRWAANTFRWARPLHSVLAVFDGKTVPGALDLGNGKTISFSNTTRGHRFLSDGKLFTVTGFDDYKKKLAAAHVILDQTERREKIWTGVQDIARAQNFTVKADEKLLTEIVGLVEWPVPFMGTFDQTFLSIPAEVISTSMRENQRYFSVLDANGKLANRFITLANVAPDDQGKTIIYGNEKVLRARLSDARFFWDQDQKIKLADYLPQLEKVRFHEKLGTVAAKSERTEKLASTIAGLIGADKTKAARAAKLAKADLVTGMVREFPELQGIMGGYYARLSGEDADVATAIATHYSPAGPNDTCPTAPISVAVALADKIDTLVGFFSIGEKPSGSKDPFALRRAALGIIRIILENNLVVSLANLFEKSAQLYQLSPPKDLNDFIIDRLRVTMADQKLPQKVIDAVIDAKSLSDMTGAVNRMMDISSFLATSDGEALRATIKRAVNILQAAKIDKTKDVQLQEKWFGTPEEQSVFSSLERLDKPYSNAVAEGRYVDAINFLLELQQPVSKFFDNVIIMDSDDRVRENRLALVGRVKNTFCVLADFTRIV